MSQDSAFQILRLPEKFSLSARAIESNWQEAIALVHPDRFANRSAAEKRVAEQWATRINDAKATLLNPVTRAEALLKIAGVDLQSATDTKMPMDFLAHQMQLRESADAGKDISVAVESDFAKEMACLKEAIDVKKDWQEARTCARRLLFIQKLAHDLDIQLGIDLCQD